MIDRRRFMLGSSALLLGASLPSFASSAVATEGSRLVFGYPPGSVGTELGQACLGIFNARAGARYSFENLDSRNSRAATEQVRNGPIDGTRLLQTQSTSMVLMPSIYRDLGYDPLLDFAPVVSLGELTYSLTLGPAVPASVTTLAHYLDWVDANPDQGEVGFAMHGSQGHLALLMLARAKNVSLDPRPYRGSFMLLKDLMENSLAAGFTAAGNGNRTLWASGKLRSIGVTSAQRQAHWPAIPTLAEQGVDGMDLMAWYAWYAPAAIPAPALASLRDQAAAMKRSPEFAPLLASLNMNVTDLDPGQIQQRTRTELATYQRWVRQYGIRPLD